MIFSKKGPPAMPDLDALRAGVGKPGAGGAADEGGSAQVKQLEAKVEKLTALVEAMWSILESKSSLNHKHLQARLDKIVEMRSQREVEKNECPKCKQKNSTAKTQCIYCGAGLPPTPQVQQNPFNF